MILKKDTIKIFWLDPDDPPEYSTVPIKQYLPPKKVGKVSSFFKRSGSLFRVSEGLLGSVLRALGSSGTPFWELLSSILRISGSPGVPWCRLGRQKSRRTDFLKKKVVP